MIARHWRRFKNACGWQYGKPGFWIITNFLWNTLPWSSPRRYKIQRYIHDVLIPILNPERLPRK